MKDFKAAFLITAIIASIAIVAVANREGDHNHLIESKQQTIDSLKTALQTSNEKRGRLFLALLYTDIPDKQKSLDSLLIEIGKDN